MEVGYFGLAVGFDGQCTWPHSHDMEAADWMKHLGHFTRIHKTSLTIFSGKECMSHFILNFLHYISPSCTKTSDLRK